MDTYLLVLSGPLKGGKFKIFPGMEVGRRAGHIQLADDAKVSGLHARIEKNNKDQWVFRDLNSANGLLLGDRRVRHLSLLPGVVFRIGQTQFKVLTDMQKTQAVQSQTPIQEVKIDIPVAQIDNGWFGRLVETLPPLMTDNPASTRTVFSFSPPIILKFISGPQAGDTIPIGFGPRVAGFNSFDLRLMDPKAPDQAFQLFREGGVTKVKDLSEGRVQLNNFLFEAEPLRNKDILRFGDSAIQVENL